MSWLDNMKVQTSQDKLNARIERNREKALAAQLKAIEKVEKSDKEKKYEIGVGLDSTTEKNLKDYIKAIQADIENPSSDSSYEPVPVP